MAFAERDFALNANEHDGKSYREVIEGLIERSSDPQRRAGYEAELECPPFPMALDYLWHNFHRLAQHRGSNGMGLNPISWPDIDAFVRHTKFELAPWEIEVIEALDRLYLAAQAKSQRDSTGGS